MIFLLGQSSFVLQLFGFDKAENLLACILRLAGVIKFKVANIIVGLDTGGAEMMLYKLLLASQRRKAFSSVVFSLTGVGKVGARIRNAGVEVRALNMSRDPRSLTRVALLARWLKEMRPDVVQTWMYHADLIGGCATKISLPGVPIVWNVRNSDIGTGLDRAMILRSLAMLSKRIPSRILCNSYAGYETHSRIGFDASRMRVIPNGFDTDLFRPDKNAGRNIRKRLGIAEDTIVVGMVARYAPEKDHALFFRAGRRLVSDFGNVLFVLCGTGIDWDNEELVTLIRENGLEKNCRLLGCVTDIPRIMNALDIFALSSYTEGFPNVVGEAMACGVPCVVTAAGDSAAIVGDTGKVVPIRDEIAFSQGLRELASLDRSALQEFGEQARLRIQREYSLEAVLEKYVSIYMDILRHSKKVD